MEIDKKFQEKTFDFHGHICWASTIGDQAGVVALRELGAPRTGTFEELHCLLAIGENHGAQCFADGVQSSTGCTMGKGNMCIPCSGHER